MKTCFPGLHVHGCFFHWNKAVHRHVGMLGLQTAYIEGEGRGAIHQIIEKILALLYMPRRHVKDALDELWKMASTCPQLMRLLTPLTWYVFIDAVVRVHTVDLVCTHFF